MPKSSQNKDKKASFFDLAMSLLSDLPERSREIVEKRFGLGEEKTQTLEKIGRDHKITRERVRQIIGDALKRLAQKKNEPSFEEAEKRIAFTILNNNGIIEEEKLISKLSDGSQKDANAIEFFGAISDRAKTFEEKDEIKKSWLVSEDVLRDVREVGTAAKEIFARENKPLVYAELAKKIGQKMFEKKKNISDYQISDYLDVISSVQKNKFGKWGLAGWKEINPKGTRERIYLILKEKREPLHFTQIARMIDQYDLGKRKAHPQTVHNELIKDDRFILVGRGIYALKEWGYKKGTIQEVLEDILKKSQKPLGREEIVSEVMKLRRVKKATIMINLNNQKVFEKVNNFYIVKN